MTKISRLICFALLLAFTSASSADSLHQNMVTIQRELERVEIDLEVARSEQASLLGLIQQEQLKEQAALSSNGAISSSHPRPYDTVSLANRLRASVAMVVAVDDAGEQVSCGSAFVVSQNGHLLTNAHVVDGTEVIYLIWPALPDRPLEKAELIHRYDTEMLDLALLRSEGASDMIPLEFSYEVSTGSRVVAAGFPMEMTVADITRTQGAEMTITEGIVSATRIDRISGRLTYLQTDALISKGNSGGPLLDIASGKVLGVVTWKIENSHGMAIPAAEIYRAFSIYLDR